MRLRARWLWASLGVVLLAGISYVAYLTTEPRERAFRARIAEMRASGGPFGASDGAEGSETDSETAIGGVMAAGDAMVWGAGWKWDGAPAGEQTRIAPYHDDRDDWWEVLEVADRESLARSVEQLRPFRDAVTRALTRQRTGHSDGLDHVQRLLLAGAVADPDPVEREKFLATACAVARRFLSFSALAEFPSLLARPLDRMRRDVLAGRLDPVTARRRLDDVLTHLDEPNLVWVLQHRAQSILISHEAYMERDADTRRGKWWGVALDRRFGDPPNCDSGDDVAADYDALGRALAAYDPYSTDIDPWTPEIDRALADQRCGSRLPMFRDESWPGCVATVIAIRPQSDVARIWLAAAEHRALHGDWPQELAALAPLFPSGVPKSPTSGAPYTIVRDGERFEVRWDGVLGADGRRREGVAWAFPPDWRTDRPK